MAVSKRTRFEVLKRDKHTCQYCGAQAPDATLQIDHVIPVSLGGTNKPNNLTTACIDCNSGKGSTHPDADTVEEVNEAALAYSKALKQALHEKIGATQNARAVRLDLEDHWDEMASEYAYGNPRMEDNWGTSLKRWLDVGLTPDFLKDAMEISMSKRDVTNADKYRYFCGIVYRTLDDAHEQVQAQLGTPKPKTCGHCMPCVWPQDYADTLEEAETMCVVYGTHPDKDEDILCPVCKKKDCLYGVGNDYGIQEGMQHEFQTLYYMVEHYRNCPEVKRNE